MKIAVLCNDALAIPSVQLLIRNQALVGIAAPLTFDPFPFRMQDLATEYRVPFSMIHKSTAEAELETFIRAVDPDVVFVMLWPARISAKVLELARLGFFNWHPGLLPQFRGPDPIFWEIRNREPFGGITVHKMTSQIDQGPIAYLDRVPIQETETYSDHLKKIVASATKATEYMLSVFPTGIPLSPQDESLAGYQQAPSFPDRTIDWKNQNADSVLAFIRASELYGGAITYFRHAQIHLVCASGSEHFVHDAEPGMILSTSPMMISCRDHSAICVEQINAGRIFSASEFCEAFTPGAGELLN